MVLKDLLLLIYITVTGAFVIPEGTEDGIYEHYIDDQGADVLLKIANATVYSDVELQQDTTATTSSSSRIVKRDINCGGNRGLNTANTNGANRDLDGQCDRLPPTKSRHNFYAIRGDVVAFYRNFQFFYSARRTSAERQRTSAQVTGQSGRYNAGWYTVGGANWSYGYDRGRCFCGGCV